MKEVIKINNTKLPCSLNDTTVLRDLIMKNPDLPLIIFCGEEAWSGDYGYTQAIASNGSIETLTLYNDMWYPKDDYEEQLANDLSDEEEYRNLSDEAYDQMIKKKVAETEFVEAIVIYVG